MFGDCLLSLHGKKMWKTPDSKTSCLAFSYHYGFDKTGRVGS